MKCYQLAIKSFIGSYHQIFEWEREAYLTLDGVDAMVKYLGEYEIDEWVEKDIVNENGVVQHVLGVERTFNILLEFGDHDLFEFFADPLQHSPHLHDDIVDFWQSLFKVAEALKKLHHRKVKHAVGREEEFDG
jgi:hypothetical protein